MFSLFLKFDRSHLIIRSLNLGFDIEVMAIEEFLRPEDVDPILKKKEKYPLVIFIITETDYSRAKFCDLYHKIIIPKLSTIWQVQHL